MPGETKHGIECSQFEALLSEALDGQLGSSGESFWSAWWTASRVSRLWTWASGGREGSAI